MDWQLTASYVLSGLIVWGVGQLNWQMRQAAKWRLGVDQRLTQIELQLGIANDMEHHRGQRME